MINDEFTEYCYLNILDIYYNQDINERLKLIRSFNVLKDLLLKLDEDNPQLFSSFFQRLHFIITKYQINKNLAKKIYTLRAFIGKLSSDKSIAIIEYELALRLCDIFLIIKNLSNTEFPINVPFINDDIINEDRNKFYLKKDKHKTSFVSLLRFIVNSIDSIDNHNKILVINAKDSNYEDILIKVQGIWFAHQNMYSNGTVVNILNCGFDGKCYFTNDYSLLSLEPDYLIDVTDIADCFSSNYANPNLYFLAKFQKSPIGKAAAIGNIVNHIFDELIISANIDFDEVFECALRIKPLQIIALLESQSELNDFKQVVYQNYGILKEIVSGFDNYDKSIEPSFISAKFGLQGRLDLLLSNNSNQKDVVELKSGKAPNRDLLYTDVDSRRYGLSIWKNHCIQAICYIMLLDSAYKNSKITSSILYSNSELNFLRNVPNIIQLKREVLKCRNYIVAVERALSNDNFSIFKKFNSNQFGNYPPYKQQSINEFAINYSGFSELEREYFHHFIGFLTRENFCRKLGNGKYNNGFASLWLDSIEEKEDNYSILRYLNLDIENSDFERMHLKFYISHKSGVSSIRRGDICIVYPIPKNGSIDVLSGQILKGSIREIIDDYIVISLRNKLNKVIFQEFEEWAIEPDSIESLSKLQFASLYSLLRSSKEKREMLLGIASPRKISLPKVFYPELNENQLQMLYKALSAKDYFLLQGPPGTGKTSYMLRFMVKYLFDNTNQNILLLAYTNRAVDEICSALLRIDDKFPFLRLGGKESSDFLDNLISVISETASIAELRDRIDSTRVFVSTIASALTIQEIFKIKSFQNVIIDEASQVSEPYLFAILTLTDRFILIGDEKQLPAVVLQTDSSKEINSDVLKEIELLNLGDSYFDRILRLAKRHNRSDSFGMLTHQARMNDSIMNLANELFYSNSLLRANTTNNSMIDFNFDDSNSELFKIIAQNEIIFVNTKTELKSKINNNESEIVFWIAKELFINLDANFTSETLGIIAPFRAQVSHIYNKLDSILQKLVSIDTVERFQGSEREVIIISFALNHQFDLNRIINISEIDGVFVDRKLNVAITRAKQRLILLGNAELLSQSSVHRNMIDIIKKKHKFIEQNELFSINIDD